MDGMKAINGKMSKLFIIVSLNKTKCAQNAV